MSKACSQCNEIKSYGHFWRNTSSHDGFYSICKECAKRQGRGYKTSDPGSSRSKRSVALKRLYGLTLDKLEVILAEQDGRCANDVCRKTISFDAQSKSDQPHVDHDHDTYKVRGLLCLTCNVGIGMLGDTVESLQGALDYLLTARQRERLNPEAPTMWGDAIVRPHENINRERSAEMTDPVIKSS